jgi:hypothetical protein
MELARGELLAVLDGDDMWPPEKIGMQVELFARRPEVGLTYTDMAVIDADDQIVHPSWAEAFGVTLREGRPVRALVADGNFAAASSIVFRASLLPVLKPIPARIPYVDWWLAARAAQVSDIALVSGVRTLYRLHDRNLTFGTTGSAELREQRKYLAFRRSFLTYLRATDAPLADLAAIGEAVLLSANWVSEQLDIPVGELSHVAKEDRDAAAAAARAANAAEAAGEWASAAALYLNALGHDLASADATEGLDRVRAQAMDATT